MVRTIAVVRGNECDTWESTISKIGDPSPSPPMKWLDCFDAMTSNFEDLGFWEDEFDLHAKPVPDVIQHIERVLKMLYSQGYAAYNKEPEDPFRYTHWEWGHLKREEGRCGLSKDMNKEDRIAVLVFHLEHMLKRLCKFNSNEYTTWIPQLCD
jgi:hypothetical protein